MFYMRRLFLLIIFTVLAFSFAVPVSAAESVTIYFFYGDGCPHCAKEELFLAQVEKDFPDVKIQRYEVWHNTDNQKLVVKIGSELDISVTSMPVTIINGKAFNGYFNDESTGQMILNAIFNCQAIKCEDNVAPIIAKLNKKPTEVESGPMTPNPVLPPKFKIPFIGEIKTASLSLPTLTIIMGGLDGFNPCAMWILLFLISLLLGMKSRKRMLILGSAFIFASALSYFVFMAAWLNLFLFIGMFFWIRLLIGGFAVGAGIFNVKGFWKKKDGGCSAAEQEKKTKIFSRIKEIIYKRQFLWALGGIMILAFTVNLFELLCSAGFPAIYTQMLALSNLPVWKYYAYLLLYILFYLLDDLVVFIIAMTTLRAVGISTKYGRYSSLIGGIIMVLIGVLLMLKPGWLMFG